MARSRADDRGFPARRRGLPAERARGGGLGLQWDIGTVVVAGSDPDRKIRAIDAGTASGV